MDYDKLSKQLFFRVYEDSLQEEVLLFDQLDLNSRVDAGTGMPHMTIGQAIVTVDAKVEGDF